jgi:hypothetical protein
MELGEWAIIDVYDRLELILFQVVDKAYSEIPLPGTPSLFFPVKDLIMFTMKARHEIR